MFTKIQLLYKILKLAQEPGRTQYVFDISNLQIKLAKPEDLQRQLDGVNASDSNFKKLFERRNEVKTFNLDKLITLPENTFGYRYAKHMKSHGLDPEFYDKFTHDDEWNFYRFRMRQTHDIWHVLSGFTTHYVGETGLQSFYIGQNPSLLSPAIITAFVFHSVLNKKIQDVPRLMEAIGKGYENGKNAKPLIGIMWEELWERDYNELVKELNIAQVQGL